MVSRRPSGLSRSPPLSAKPLFKPGVVYPSDEVGEHTEVDGVVARVSDLLGDDRVLDVNTEHGVLQAVMFGRPKYVPEVGQEVRIRVYASGGGWYPDNKVVRWSNGEFSFESG